MLARLTAFVVWALVAATAVFWGLRLLVRPQSAPAYAVVAGDAGLQRGDLTRLLGASPVAPVAAAPAAPELASRFRLLGVMAGKSPESSGFATIAVDSKPARTYPVGAALDGDLVLQSVSLRSASIGHAQGNGTALTLEIPPLPAAATGTLPSLGVPAPVVPPGAVPTMPNQPPPIVPPPPGVQPPPPMPPGGRLPRIPGAAAR